MEPTSGEHADQFSLHQYDGMVYSSTFPANILDQVKETAFHDDDVVVVTYPKSGTTWMQAIVSLVQNDADFKDFDEVPVYARFIFIEGHFPGMNPELERWSSTPPPHLMKTHLNAKFYHKTLKESKTKFIVVFRNPKDLLVSYYHFYRMNSSLLFNGNWNDFFKRFEDKKINHGDYFDAVLSWWNLKDDPRVLILQFEDMLKRPQDAVKKVVDHMGKAFSDDIIQKIVEKTSFISMKENPAMNYKALTFMNQDISPFFRKGTIGDWKNYFTTEQSEYVDKLVAQHLIPVGLNMTYTLT